MKRFGPYIFLLPALLLLALLPRQLRGELPYHVSTFTYLESLLMWLLLFVAFRGLSRRARWTRPIFVVLGLETIAASGYSLWRGTSGCLAFLAVLLAVGIFTAYAWIVSPPFRKPNAGVASRQSTIGPNG